MFLRHLRKLHRHTPTTTLYFSTINRNLIHPKLQSYVDKISVDPKHELCPLASTIQKLQKDFSEVQELVSGGVKTDAELITLAEADLKNLENEIQELADEFLQNIIETEILEIKPTEEVLLEITAGVGGQEAMLFATELFNLYLNYASFKNWDVSPIEIDRTELGGLRHGTLLISSPQAYPALHKESGTHRVQRIPKTEKSGRIHTSTSSISILPTPTPLNTPKIPPTDLRIETKRASGAGGQHVNTTESAVRITHIPTNIQVDCQTERSQISNRANAMKMLVAKLYKMELDKRESLNKNLKKSQVLGSERSDKIRTWNYLQDRVTDHRFGVSVFNLKDLMKGGGEFDEFLDELRREEREGIRKGFFGEGG